MKLLMHSSHLRKSEITGVGWGVSSGIFKHSPGVSHVWSSLTGSALDIIPEAPDVPAAPLSHKASLSLSCSLGIRLMLQKTPPDSLPVSQQLIGPSEYSMFEFIHSSADYFKPSVPSDLHSPFSILHKTPLH